MALQKQTARFPFAQGLDTKTDEYQVLPGKLLACENGHFRSIGAITKQPGYTALSKDIQGGGSIASGVLAATLKDELLVTTGSAAYAYAAGGWVNKGVCESIQFSTKPIINNSYQQTCPDIAVHPLGITVACWEDSSTGYARYSVFDTATNQPIRNNVQLGTQGQKPKPLVLGNKVVIVFFEQTNNHLQYVAVPVLAPYNVTSPADICTNSNSTPVFDACVSSDQIYVVYANNSGTANKISLMFLNSQFQLSTEYVIGETIVNTCSISSDTSFDIWVSWHNGTQIRTAVYNRLLDTQLLAPTTVATVSNVRNIATKTNGHSTIFYEVSAAAAYNYLVSSVDVTKVGVATAGATVRSVGLASKPWTVNGTPHVLIAHQSALQSTYFVMTQAGSIVGRLASGVAGGLTAKSCLPEVANPATGVFTVPYLKAQRLDAAVGVTQTGVMLASWNFAATSQPAIELSDNLHITGGQLWGFDGSQVAEHGFHLFPENVVAGTPTSGGSLSAGQYQYKAVYEWTDNYGLRHRSAPSPAVTVTVTSSQQVPLTIPTLRLTNKTSAISIAVYRTQVNQTVFYRVSSFTTPLVNNKTVDTVSYTDGQADTAIAGNEQLYTNGGEVENVIAPASSIITNYKGRAILVPSENPLQWWFSKQAVEGLPVEFNDSFVQTVDQRGGPITAIYQMDDKLVIFKGDRVFYTAGDGPSANGINLDYAPAQLVTGATTGCVAQESVVSIPNGLLFQAPAGKGIWLLDRSLNTQYLGAPVEGLLSNGELVTSATQVPGTTQIRFTLDSGIVLVYDYLVEQWSTITKVSAIDSTIFGGRFCALTAAGQILQETPDIYTNRGNFVPLKVKTGWLSFAGLQGYQRVYRLMLLGKYRGPHKVRVSVSYDFNPEPSQSVVVNLNDLFPQVVYGDTGDPALQSEIYYGLGIYGQDWYGQSFGGIKTYGDDSPYGGEYPLEQLRIHLQQQKCQAIQVTIEDVQSPAFNEGLSLSGIAFEVGVLSGFAKKPAGSSAG